MRKKILGLLIAFGLSIPAFATITVSPTRLEINANKIRNNYVSTALEVRGRSDQPTRYKAYAGYFTINDNATMNMADNNPDNPHDISKKIRFVPSEFTVPPGKTQKVRVNIVDIKNLPDGESRAILFLEDVQPKETNIPNAYGISAQLVLKTRIGVPVYVDKGNFKKTAEIESFNVVSAKDGQYTEVKILSKGNSKIRYAGKVQIVSGKKLLHEYPIEGNVVGAGKTYVAKQKIETENIKEAGEYTLRYMFTYFDENNNKKTIKKDATIQIKSEKI